MDNLIAYEDADPLPQSLVHTDFQKMHKAVKLLNEFEIDEKTKDKHATICKECVAKRQPPICSCSCEICLDGKIMKTAFASMELLLSRIDSGLELPDAMYVMIANLAHSAGVLCDDCEKELANK